MIDWITMNLDLPEHLWARAQLHVDRNSQIQKICPATGEIEWSVPCRESIRSDTHQITVKVSPSRINFSGSPARSMGLRHNVWGSGNLIECGRAHLRVADEALPEIPLAGLGAWEISRVDVTHNYVLGAAAEVRQALAYLREYDGGRYKCDTRRGETVYWSPGSAMRGAKAYHKGPHLRCQVGKGQAKAEPWEVELAELLPWGLVKMLGHREAAESMRRSTWYEHRKVLFDAGLSWGDLAKGQVVPFRRKVLVLGEPARSWGDVRLILEKRREAA